MAILSKNKRTRKNASGHEYPKLADTVFGYRKSKINKDSELFNNDYLYFSSEKDEDDEGFFEDREVGINKQHSMFHDDHANDSYKNLSSSRERRERLEFEDYLAMVRTRIRFRG